MIKGNEIDFEFDYQYEYENYSYNMGRAAKLIKSIADSLEAGNKELNAYVTGHATGGNSAASDMYCIFEEDLFIEEMDMQVGEAVTVLYNNLRSLEQTVQDASDNAAVIAEDWDLPTDAEEHSLTISQMGLTTGRCW